jgi:hypothetical protein
LARDASLNEETDSRTPTLTSLPCLGVTLGETWSPRTRHVCGAVKRTVSHCYSTAGRHCGWSAVPRVVDMLSRAVTVAHMCPLRSHEPDPMPIWQCLVRHPSHHQCDPVSRGEVVRKVSSGCNRAPEKRSARMETESHENRVLGTESPPRRPPSRTNRCFP